MALPLEYYLTSDSFVSIANPTCAKVAKVYRIFLFNADGVKARAR